MLRSNDPNKVWPTGATLSEAEEVHSCLVDGTRVFGLIALIAHVLVAVSTRGLARRHIMNNAKIWLVVKPTFGVPLFLTTVAVRSFAVHVAVIGNTTWVADFLSGKQIGAGAAQLILDKPKAAQAS